jgi:hypothetical protein
MGYFGYMRLLVALEKHNFHAIFILFHSFMYFNFLVQSQSKHFCFAFVWRVSLMDERFQVYYNMTTNSISLYCVMITIIVVSHVWVRMIGSAASGGRGKCCVANEHIQVDSIGFWRWWITHRITGFSDFVHRPDSKQLEEKHVSETGSVSALRWRETPPLLGPLERANLNHWTHQNFVFEETL